MQAAVNLGEVKNVQGLAGFKHHVVGNIDQRRDAALPAAGQALDHPRGRGGLRVQPTNDAA